MAAAAVAVWKKTGMWTLILASLRIGRLFGKEVFLLRYSSSSNQTKLCVQRDERQKQFRLYQFGNDDVNRNTKSCELS